METPNIEYQGKIYEFKANFELKLNFNKEVKLLTQKKSLEIKNNFSNDELKAFEKLEKLVVSGKITEEVLEKDEELQKEISRFSDLLNALDTSDIAYKYCYLMLKNRYGISEETFEDMLNDFANDYGIDNVSLMLSKVIEKVFTQQVEESKKPLPTWMK